MKKRMILILTLLVSSMSNLFAQFEVMTSDQAKKELSENLSLTSAEVDQMISEYLIPFSYETMQNGLGIRNIDPYLFDDIIEIKFYVAQAPGLGVPCVNHTDSTLSIQRIEPGYYTISQKILYNEQLTRRTKELLDSYKMSSLTQNIKNSFLGTYVEVCDSLIVKGIFEEYINNNDVSKKDFQSELIKGTYRGPLSQYYILVLTDEKGNDFYIPDRNNS